MKQEKLIIITAPSGAGKTTLVRRLLAACPGLAFSVSACTRSPRAGEVHGEDYYFFDAGRFRQLIEEDAFAEWEMVYQDKYYGTLRSELERIWESGRHPLVDIDVKGALSIAAAYPGQALSIFIQAPSMEALRERLQLRGTETPESLEERLQKAGYEMSFAGQFDRILVNDNLEDTAAALLGIVTAFLKEG